MEEVLGANQSAEQVETPVVTPETPVESTAPVTTPEAPSEPQGIRVKYNKEERVIGLDEAPDWIQKGLNYDKVQEKANQFEQHSKQLERTAKFYGYDNVDTYLAALDEAEQQQRVQREAERLGVDESVVLEHLEPMRKQLNQYEEKMRAVEQQEQMLKVQQEVTDLRAKYPDFDTYKDNIVDMVAAKGYSLEDAYILSSHQDKLSRIQKETEANTIRGLQQNAASTPGALGQGDVDHNVGFASLPIEKQREMIEEVKQGKRKSL